MLAKEITPSKIVKYLNQYVIGQDEAKKVLAVAIYTHYRKIAAFQANPGAIAKSNVLLIGPSGTGKTLLCETLSSMIGVPFVTADATSLAQTKYVNEEIDAILQRLLEKADDDIGKAQMGIIFIDEIDKLKAGKDGSRQVTSGEAVQHALLKIMEGSPVKLSDNRYINTTHILFICGGAFVDLEKIMDQTRGYGFIATTGQDDKNILDRLNNRVKPTDLFEFGLIPEFTGRLPIIARLNELNKEMLVRIMSVPKNSIYQQFSEMLAMGGVELSIQKRVFEQISEIAIEYKTGARSLRGIFEELMTPILYALPDHPEIGKVEIASLFEEPKYYRRAGTDRKERDATQHFSGALSKPI